MSRQPVLLPLGPARLGIDQVRARQAGDKDLGLAGDASIDYGQRHAGPIDFERGAGAMQLAHPRRSRAPLPGAEMLAELGVAVALRLPAQIFQPQQPQRHAATAQLLLDDLPIRQRTIGIPRVTGREQTTVELLLAQPRRRLPAQLRRRRAVEIFLHRRPRDPRAARHRRIAQPEHQLQPQHFLDPPHRHPRSRHLPAPPKRREASRHYLPFSSDANADQGCRKRRNRVPDWSEIRCRYPPKSPAAFDRNHLPLCSDFCNRRRGEGRDRCLVALLQRGTAASEPRLPYAAANLRREPVDMWTIGVADRLRFPRFPSKLGKPGNARLRPHPHRRNHQQKD